MKLGRTAPKKPVEKTVQDLEAENLELKLSLAEMFEKQEQDKVELQMALTEVYELVLG